MKVTKDSKFLFIDYYSRKLVSETNSGRMKYYLKQLTKAGWRKRHIKAFCENKYGVSLESL